MEPDVPSGRPTLSSIKDMLDKTSAFINDLESNSAKIGIRLGRAVSINALEQPRGTGEKPPQAEGLLPELQLRLINIHNQLINLSNNISTIEGTL